MPPHCDSMDGPVVAAARQALGGGARGVADRWFYETAVRVHRSHEHD